MNRLLSLSCSNLTAAKPRPWHKKAAAFFKRYHNFNAACDAIRLATSIMNRLLILSC